MLHYGYYVIEATSALHESLKSLPVETREVLLEPQLWRDPEPDRWYNFTQDHLLRIKHAFVVHLADLLQGDPTIELMAISSASGPEDFDRWWTVHRFSGIDQELPEVEIMHNLRS